MSKGDRIRKQRELLGLAQVDVAEALGVSKQLYYKYENDIITNIPPNKIEELAKIDRQIAKLIDLYAIESMPINELKKRINELEKKGNLSFSVVE